MKPGIYLTAKEILKLKTELPPIKKILDEFQNPNIRIFTEEALKKVAPDEFWTCPCSTRMAKDIPNRKFHASFNLITLGGIINHSIICSSYAKEALRRYPVFRKKVDDWRNWIPDPEWLDMASSSGLLQDICKDGDNRMIPWGEKTHHKHGQLAATLLSHLPSFLKLTHLQREMILNGIKWHMGYFGPIPNRPFTEFEQVIQEADFYSTRVFLTGVDIQLINYPPKTRK